MPAVDKDWSKMSRAAANAVREFERARAQSYMIAKHPWMSVLYSPHLPVVVGSAIVGGVGASLINKNNKEKERAEQRKVDALTKLWESSASYNSQPKQAAMDEEVSNAIEAILTLVEKDASAAPQEEQEVHVEKLEDIPVTETTISQVQTKTASIPKTDAVLVDPANEAEASVFNTLLKYI